MSDTDSRAQGIAGLFCFFLIIAGGIAVFGLWVDQCHLGHGDSLYVQVDSVRLTTEPTDNVFLGLESLFGKPADEISVNLHSAVLCGSRNEPQEIKQDQIIYFGDTLSINTFYGYGFSFWLSESDGGFEGADDLSQIVTIPSSQTDNMRQTFDRGVADFIKLDYSVVVKGQNIFQENTWFGFLAENLCVSAFDFVTGPWTGKALKAAKKVLRFKSGDMARLYNSIKFEYKSGALSKTSLYKSLITYQLREGSKSAVLSPAKANAQEVIKEWALNPTLLDEKIKETVRVLKDDGVYTELEGQDIFHEVTSEISKWAGYWSDFTDSLEFCLIDVFPPSKDALYHVEMTVRR